MENSNRKSKIWNRFETSTQTKSRKFHRTVGSFVISSKSKFRVPCLSTHSYAPWFIVYPVRYRKQFDNFVSIYAALIFLEFMEKNHTFSEASNMLNLNIFWCQQFHQKALRNLLRFFANAARDFCKLRMPSIQFFEGSICLNWRLNKMLEDESFVVKILHGSFGFHELIRNFKKQKSRCTVSCWRWNTAWIIRSTSLES